MFSSRLLRLDLAFVALLVFSANATAHMELSPDELVEYHSNVKRDSEALNQCLQSPKSLCLRSFLARESASARGYLSQPARCVSAFGYAGHRRDALQTAAWRQVDI
jgi:hypothetical protein